MWGRPDPEGVAEHEAKGCIEATDEMTMPALDHRRQRRGEGGLREFPGVARTRRPPAVSYALRAVVMTVLSPSRRCAVWTRAEA